MKANTGASGLDALYLGGVYVSIANADQAWWSSRAGVIEKKLVCGNPKGRQSRS
jgi:hypothetical protein